MFIICPVDWGAYAPVWVEATLSAARTWAENEDDGDWECMIFEVKPGSAPEQVAYRVNGKWLALPTSRE